MLPGGGSTMIGKATALLALVIVALACSGQEQLQCEESLDLEATLHALP